MRWRCRLHRACAICGAWPRPDSAGWAAQSLQFPRRASLMTGCLWNVWLIRVSCPLRALSSSYPVAWIVSTASVVTANTYLPSGRREPLTDPREKPWASGSGALSWLAAPHVCPQPVTAESGVSCVTTGPLEGLPGLPTTCPVPFPLLVFVCPSTVTSCDQECCRPSLGIAPEGGLGALSTGCQVCSSQELGQHRATWKHRMVGTG